MKWNEILYTNVKNYCDLNDLKLGEFEKSLEVGKGYMSRQAQVGTIPVQTAILISKILCVSIDTLLSEDIYTEALKEKERVNIRKQISDLEQKLEDMDNDDSCDRQTEG